MAVGEPVTIINRTSRSLDVKFNGRTRVLTPGPNVVTSEWVRYAKLQNPRMGTFLPGTLEGEYLVGVEGVDPCDMIDPSDERRAIEMFDRGGEASAGNKVTDLGTGERDPRRMNVGEFAAPLPNNAEFNGR